MMMMAAAPSASQRCWWRWQLVIAFLLVQLAERGKVCAFLPALRYPCRASLLSPSAFDRTWPSPDKGTTTTTVPPAARCRHVATRRSATDDNEYFAAELPGPERLDAAQLQTLTVAQLQQQLRLRQLPVSGTKQVLVDRLLLSSAVGAVYADAFDDDLVDDDISDDDDDDGDDDDDDDDAGPRDGAKNNIPGDAPAAKKVVDVSAYLDQDDRGRDYKSSVKSRKRNADSMNSARDAQAEVWGAAARMVDDYEGRDIVVDAISTTMVEFVGSNNTYVSALVCASRDALRPFLAGGHHHARPPTPVEDRLRELQTARERAARQPVTLEDASGVDAGDETGLYVNILDRDFSDWGRYTPTGAQLSAQQLTGVLLLSDVYGPFTNATTALCQQIAFECQPVVVLAPDVFRGQPWTGTTTNECNAKGQTFDSWRAQFDDDDHATHVSVDMRAAAACLRETYGVDTVVVWGMCFGGGRALEAAAGYVPQLHDVNGQLGPPPVQPAAVVAWYPTRYHAESLFGRNRRRGLLETDDNDNQQMAIMAVFAGRDNIPGATPADAQELQLLLDEDARVKDHMIKVFADEDHGFAHMHLGHDSAVDNDDDETTRFLDDEFGGAGRLMRAEDNAATAFLLSTAFMETYSRTFLPTIGPPISRDDEEVVWGQQLEYRRPNAPPMRNVREEIDQAVGSFQEEPLGGYRIDPSDESQEDELLRLLKSMESDEQKRSEYAIEDDDDISIVYAKLKACDPDFQLF